MKPIKFRGKRIKTGEWSIGYLVSRDEINVNTFGGTSIIGHQVDPATVGQFTGRRDAKRDDVFDGDLMLASNLSKVNIFTGETRKSNDWKKIEVRISHVGVVEKREISGSRDKEYPTSWERFLPVEMKYYERCGTIHGTPSENKRSKRRRKLGYDEPSMDERTDNINQVIESLGDTTSEEGE